MPAKVDADDRRRRLTLAAAELIADEGIGALTNQRIAERLAASTTIVTHYFRSKRELVLETYQAMATRSRVRVERAIEEQPADRLAGCLHALLPLDDESLVEWKVWLVYPRHVGRRRGAHQDLGFPIDHRSAAHRPPHHN